jgi:predicted nucleotidyltransferase
MVSELLQRDPALAAIVRRVVELYRPERVYLFGSKARGDGGPDSDYDVMVVVPDEADAERLQSRRFHEQPWDLERSADVVVIKRSSFEGRAAHVVTSLPATVIREGKLLYAA